MFKNDFNKDKNTLQTITNSILIPDNLEGFIYYLLNYRIIKNPTLKDTYRLPQESSRWISFQKTPSYDSEKDVIELSSNDIETVNLCFEEELNKLYKRINTSLFEFHWLYRKKTTELTSFYDELIEKFTDDYFDGYNSGKLSNLGKIKFKEFKSNTQEEYNNTKDLLLYLRFSLSNKKTDFQQHQIWYNIFKTQNYFHKFENYINFGNIVEPIPDLSFVFQKMIEDGFIYKIKHNDFAAWLLKNDFISNRIYNAICDNKGFRSLDKSFSADRLNKYNNYFKN